MRVLRPTLVLLSLLVLSACTSIVVMPIELPSRSTSRVGDQRDQRCAPVDALIARIVELEREVAALRAKGKS